MGGLGGGLPVSAALAALRILSRPVVVEQSIFQANLPQRSRYVRHRTIFRALLGYSVAVDRTVGEHIQNLESRRQRLHEESMKNRLSQERRNEIEAEIRAITTAIAHFLAAIETEQQLQIR